jgi:hypothetical protein
MPVNWSSTTEMLTGLEPVASALVGLVIAFVPLILIGGILSMITGLFEGVVNSVGRGFRF